MKSGLRLFYSAFLVMVLLSLVCIVGCGGGSGTVPVVPTATQGPTPVTQTILPSTGGSITVSNGSVNFPANSVNKDVTVTGETSSITPNLPDGVGAASSVYNFTLSDPNAYVANSASITLPITGSTTGASIFISDNSNYTSIGGTVNGSNITATVPHFSYFVVGIPVTGPTPTATTIPVWSTEVRVDNSTGNCYYPGIAIDASGNTYTIWQDNRNFADPNSINIRSDIYFAYRPAAGTWDTEVRVTNTTGAWGHPNLAVDPSGNAYAVWDNLPVDPNGQSLTSDIYFGYRPAGGSWNTSIIASGSDFSRPDIAVDSSGNAYAVWTKTSKTAPYNSDIYFAYRPAGGSWTGTTIIASGVFYGPDITVDPTGNAYVIWGPGDSTAPQNIYYSYRPAGGSWTGSNVIAAGNTTTHITVDPSGNAYAVWEKDTYDPNNPLPTDICFGYKPLGGSWNTSIITSAISYEDPDIGVDSSGNAYVIWIDSTGGSSIYFSSRTSGSWSSAVRVDDGTATKLDDNPRIAVNPSGKIYTIWNARKGSSFYNVFFRMRE